MSRVIPTAPGWWWMRRVTASAPPPEAVLVVDVGGTLYVHREAEVDRHRYEWLEPIPAPGEVEALRRHVAELTALGVSLHKAEDRGRKEERAAIVAWLRFEGRATEGWSDYCADCIGRGEHEVAP